MIDNLKIENKNLKNKLDSKEQSKVNDNKSNNIEQNKEINMKFDSFYLKDDIQEIKNNLKEYENIISLLKKKNEEQKKIIERLDRKIEEKENYLELDKNKNIEKTVEENQKPLKLEKEIDQEIFNKETCIEIVSSLPKREKTDLESLKDLIKSKTKKSS